MTLINRTEQRVRFAAGLMIAGLVIVAISLLHNHPLSFLEFVIGGVAAMTAAIAVYLLALITEPRRHGSQSPLS